MLFCFNVKFNPFNFYFFYKQSNWILFYKIDHQLNWTSGFFLHHKNQADKQIKTRKENISRKNTVGIHPLFFFFFCDSVFTTAISFLLIIDGVTIYEFNHDWKFEGWIRTCLYQSMIWNKRMSSYQQHIWIGKREFMVSPRTQ